MTYQPGDIVHVRRKDVEGDYQTVVRLLEPWHGDETRTIWKAQDLMDPEYGHGPRLVAEDFMLEVLPAPPTPELAS